MSKNLSNGSVMGGTVSGDSVQKDVKFILNGAETVYNGNPSARLLDVLRGELGLTGTKCGCKEGECGACAVILGGRLVNSCLVAMGSLCGAEVTTIEGYSKTERFSVLEKAYASVSAVQCGFCIPGMILASECILAANPEPTEEDIRVGISGNICRCTGYNSIVKAIGIAADAQKETPVSGEACQGDGLTEALRLRKNTALIPYSGGTDIMVSGACEESEYFYLDNVKEMRQITADDEFIIFGAACKFTDVIESELAPEILKDACRQVAAPAIRNAGSIGGNIANGSAKADSALIFMVTDSKLRLMSADSERVIPIRDFYLGSGKTALAPDELIVEVLMPRFGIDNYYFKKVGARNALAISRTSYAGVMDIADGVIKNCAVAFGAVIDVVIRLPEIDAMLIGKTIEEAKALKQAYIDAYDKAIQPRRGRVSIEYRKDICMNLLSDFLERNGI